ncbi:MAG: serine/threonine-protein kinase [Nocardioides sp.]
MPRPRGAGRALAGRYVLVDQIGLGGMGSVWRAWDRRTRTFVAAKVLGHHDAGLLLRFVHEQSVRLRHPHVVTPTSWAADDDVVVLTMDLVRGGSVESLLARHGPLPTEYAAELLDQTLQALAAVHAAGLVHRDVKPANLLLEVTGTGRPHVRLADFGVAAPVHSPRLTPWPGPIGTDGYMAPEQSRGAAPDPRQDVYAAGMVAAEMLTALAPRGLTRPDSGALGPLGPLVGAMTEPDPDRRTPSAAAARAALRDVGLPAGAPWQRRPRPPDVTDTLGDPDLVASPVLVAALGAFVLLVLLALVAVTLLRT